ncbi:iron chelate uptake ABC transporter family permease subunit [Gallibacterium salpingitidis]|uniref:iron chelate uptake ABC transporter family permease subunit n=1 Tax=Gallibacterium salpingitidis TaxID=505341 RepID=UPI0026701B96|nr:iron chelate uptake ABC transporter family permease subunit [Gallibacterium salpingitidis]WKT00899.1 iron chelate uptake ABC transporter family permease subunit [Gallibacterium salpingitidis]
MRSLFSCKLKLALLLLIVLMVSAFYLFYQLPSRWEYALTHRALSLVAIIATGTAIALATMLFQPLVNNRILTPSILGLDSLYLFIQTAIIFSSGSAALLAIDSIGLFFLSTMVMLAFALLLYRLLFQQEQQNMFFLLLVGIVFGTLFQSMTTFMEVLIDPNEFQITQDIGFASFNRINTNILWIAIAIIGVTTLFSLRYVRVLDVLALGRDQAINLGVNYQRVTKQLLIIITILVSIATALVGPITFLGLLVMNITFEFMPRHQHKWLIPTAILIAIITLVLGQFIVAQILTFKTTLSILVNFIGGVYFIYLLLRTNKAWQ